MKLLGQNNSIIKFEFLWVFLFDKDSEILIINLRKHHKKNLDSSNSSAAEQSKIDSEQIFLKG